MTGLQIIAKETTNRIYVEQSWTKRFEIILEVLECVATSQFKSGFQEGVRQTKNKAFTNENDDLN